MNVVDSKVCTPQIAHLNDICFPWHIPFHLVVYMKHSSETDLKQKSDYEHNELTCIVVEKFI